MVAMVTASSCRPCTVAFASKAGVDRTWFTGDDVTQVFPFLCLPKIPARSQYAPFGRRCIQMIRRASSGVRFSSFIIQPKSNNDGAASPSTHSCSPRLQKRAKCIS